MDILHGDSRVIVDTDDGLYVYRESTDGSYAWDRDASSAGTFPPKRVQDELEAELDRTIESPFPLTFTVTVTNNEDTQVLCRQAGLPTDDEDLIDTLSSQLDAFNIQYELTQTEEDYRLDLVQFEYDDTVYSSDPTVDPDEEDRDTDTDTADTDTDTADTDTDEEKSLEELRKTQEEINNVLEARRNHGGIDSYGEELLDLRTSRKLALLAVAVETERSWSSDQASLEEVSQRFDEIAKQLHWKVSDENDEYWTPNEVKEILDELEREVDVLQSTTVAGSEASEEESLAWETTREWSDYKLAFTTDVVFPEETYDDI